MSVNRDTDFALAMGRWGEATLAVLTEGAQLCAAPMSDEVRATEMTRAMATVHSSIADAIRELRGRIDAQRHDTLVVTNANLGLGALAALLDHIANELDEEAPS